jgi:hypothetical protein
MYGIVPVEIKDPQTVLQPVITVAEVVRPEKPFTIQVKEATGKPMAYTLAIVDEGLLDITRFKTPDPHKTFYAKEALGVKTWDVFDRVMGSFAGNYGRLLTIGGDEGLLSKKSGNKANRFPPVVRHLGTFYLKANENKTHKVTLPPYFGSVKVMVVAAKNGSYGNADKAVAVRNPLMVSATAPRVLSPQEEISIPVNVFATENNIRNVTIDLSTNSNLKIIGAASQNISFSGTGEKTVYFRAKVGGNENLATIKVRASSGNQVSQSELQVEVRNPNPPITLVASQTVLAGKSVSMDVIPVGTPSKSTAMLEISAVPPLQLKKRLGYLIQYPHGCIEQTTSSVFPQLYLSALTDLDAAQLQKLENNIKAAITRLKSFQTSEGGFSYWPGMSTADDWGSNYAGHFLLEAKSRGYLVPDDLLTPWLNYTKSKAEKWSIGANSPSFYVDEITQAYRLYLLSLAGRPSLGAMNRLKEFKNLGDETKWRLAFAYQKSGYPRQASSLISGLSAKLPYKDDFGYTYGSPLRQQAMILEATAALGRTQDARILMTNIAEQLSSENWFSTQSTAYALMAIAKQSGLMSKDNALNAVCTVNGKEVKVSSRKLVYQIPVNVSKGKTQVNIKHSGTEGTLFVRIITEGKPLPEETLAQSAASSGLDMRISFMDMGGNMVDPKKLQQGKDFVAKVSINQKNNNITYKNLALSAVFPSGWEIINTRLWDAASSFSSSPYTYQDVRDDRIYTYFDLSPKNTLTYYFMLNAAYTGKYFFPITRVEAMYDNNVYAQSNGQWVEINP